MKLTKTIITVCMVALCIFGCKKDDKKAVEEEVPTTPTTPATPTVTYGTVSDGEANSYKTIVIGTQTWTAENLRSTKYNDGTDIPNVKDNQQWNTLTTGAYCYNNNADSNKTKYGCLYNWYAVNTGKLPPAGWHVADTSDYAKLYRYVANKFGTNSNAPLMDKSWKDGNNETGFSALPAGHINGSFYSGEAIFLTSNDYTSNGGVTYQGMHYRITAYANLRRQFDTFEKQSGYSIRLVKN